MQKEDVKKEKARKIIEREPKISVVQLAAEIEVHQQTVRKWIKQNPEWNWQGGRKSKKEKPKPPKRAENQKRRTWALTKAERECTAIKLAAKRAGFQSCDYGQFLASINYEW